MHLPLEIASLLIQQARRSIDLCSSRMCVAYTQTHHIQQVVGAGGAGVRAAGLLHVWDLQGAVHRGRSPVSREQRRRLAGRLMPGSWGGRLWDRLYARRSEQGIHCACTRTCAPARTRAISMFTPQFTRLQVPNQAAGSAHQLPLALPRVQLLSRLQAS